MLEDEKKILIEEPKAEVKKAGKDVLEMTKLAGYFIGKFFWSIALLIWECFSWIAYKRMRIPPFPITYYCARCTSINESAHLQTLLTPIDCNLSMNSGKV